MSTISINPRHTFELTEELERSDGTNTYDFFLTDDLNQLVPEVTDTPTPNTLGWIMLDVSNN